jgi:sedoheptulose-bisphosphatase
MSAADAITPRLFLIRHGETEWSKNGRYTGITEKELLPEGEAKVRATSKIVFGPGKLIDPTKLAKVFISPRKRAQRTWEIYRETHPMYEGTDEETTEKIAEWGYGDYEGLFPNQIKDLRKERGHDKEREWDIWRDGTEGQGGELPQRVAGRLDSLISEITALQGKALKEGDRTSDVVVVAHGHILRAFVKRWLALPLDNGLNLMLEPGGVCGLSYSHANVEQRAVLVGMSFPSGM